MLDPNSRSLYTAALSPPPGFAFGEAIATTFSLDPAFLLEAPVYLAFMAASSQGEKDPLMVVNAIRKYVDSITVYTQRGRVQVPPGEQPSPLYGYLEEMLVEVTAPAGGVFHPKLWLIRFVDPAGAPTYRLVVLTRNMTTDRSWDLSVRLEGSPGRSETARSAPLAHLIRSLPSLAGVPPGSGRAEQARRLADEVARVEWELPEGFEDLHFYLPGTPGYGWKPPTADRLVVMAPFCSDRALKMLAGQSKSAVAIVSTAEALSKLSAGTLKLFGRHLHLDEAAESGDGEDEEPQSATADNHSPARGLHAKAFVFERRHYIDHTHVVTGSANATNAALAAGKNVEILVELIGKTRTVGGVDNLLGGDGLGEYLVDYDPQEVAAPDALTEEAEEALEAARLALCEAGLALECTGTEQPNTWALTLVGTLPPLADVSSVEAWPITLGSGAARGVTSTNPLGTMNLGRFATESVTGLIAFRITHAGSGLKLTFVLNLPVEGLPEEREAAILRIVISNRDAFIRYLLLLLSADGEGEGPQLSGTLYASWFSRFVAGEDVPLLEELTRAYSRSPETLDEVAELVAYLSSSESSDVVPPEFTELWGVYQAALQENDAEK